MLETPHAVVGGAVAAAVTGATGSIPLGIAAAFVSHFICDTIPHWNPKAPLKRRGVVVFVSADFILGFSITAFFALQFPNRPEIWLGGLFGMLPDIILGIRYVFRVRWLKLYEWIHARYHVEVAPIYGVPTQLIAILLAVWYLASL